MLEWLAYVAVLIACILRTTMPYWYKNRNGNNLTFDKKYLGPMVSAIIVGFIMSGFIFTNINLPDDTVSTIVGFWTVFIAAWGLTDLFDKLGIDAWRKN